MANVIQLARRRPIEPRDLRLNIPVGDSDLRSVAILLWIASAVRVGLALVHGQAFGAEATLALLCAILLPTFIVRARYDYDTARQ